MQELQELLRLSLPACLALLPALLKLLPLTYPGRPARAGSGAGRAYLGAGALEPQQLGQVVPRCVVDRVLKHLHLLHQGQVVVVWGHLQQNRHRRESGGSAPGGARLGSRPPPKGERTEEYCASTHGTTCPPRAAGERPGLAQQTQLGLLAPLLSVTCHGASCMSGDSDFL